MGSVVQLKKQITNAYTDLVNSVDEKLSLVEDKISYKLDSKVELVKEMTAYHMTSGGKRLRALIDLSCIYKSPFCFMLTTIGSPFEFN